MKTIDAKGGSLNAALVSAAIEGALNPRWCKTHSAQLRAWEACCKEAGEIAIGIGGVSVMLDDSLPATVVEFCDYKSTLITEAPDGTPLTPDKYTVETDWKQLSEIVNLAVPGTTL